MVTKQASYFADVLLKKEIYKQDDRDIIIYRITTGLHWLLSQSGNSGGLAVAIDPYRAGCIEVRRDVIRTKYKEYKRFIGTNNWSYAGDVYETTFGDAAISIDYK